MEFLAAIDDEFAHTMTLIGRCVFGGCLIGATVGGWCFYRLFQTAGAGDLVRIAVFDQTWIPLIGSTALLLFGVGFLVGNSTKSAFQRLCRIGLTVVLILWLVIELSAWFYFGFYESS